MFYGARGGARKAVLDYRKKGGNRKMPADAGRIALVPVFPLFSSGKTVKAEGALKGNR